MSCGRTDLPPVDPAIPIVVFDLDSTLAESVWPVRGEIGPPIREGVELLLHYAGLGYRIEILTARPKIDKGLIWHWAHRHNLPVDAVTCNKAFGGLYVDDRAYCPEYTKSQKKFNPAVPPDLWKELEEEGEIEDAAG